MDIRPRGIDPGDLDVPEFQIDDDASATGVGRGIASAGGIETSVDVAAVSASASGNADRLMARCVRPARNPRPVQVYVQVYDEAARA